MSASKPASEMTGREVGELLDTLTLAQLRSALVYLSGYAPEAFDSAIDHMPGPEPDPDVLNDALAELPEAVHGENHIGNDGQVVSAIHPGECIGCGGHADHDGTWHPAMAS